MQLTRHSPISQVPCGNTASPAAGGTTGSDGAAFDLGQQRKGSYVYTTYQLNSIDYTAVFFELAKIYCMYDIQFKFLLI